MVAWQSLALGRGTELATAPVHRRWAALIIRTTRLPVLRAIGVSDHAIESVAAEPEGEASGAGVPGPDVRKLLMVGTPEDIVGAADGARRAGAAGLIGIVLGDEATVREAMRRFAADVMPALRA
jgi:hypothetical protein